MIKVGYTPRFTRAFNKLHPDLKQEVKEKIELFKDLHNHKSLRVHKLEGYFKECFGFSINYKIRVVFQYLSKDQAVLLIVGDHDVYRR